MSNVNKKIEKLLILNRLKGKNIKIDNSWDNLRIKINKKDNPNSINIKFDMLDELDNDRFPRASEVLLLYFENNKNKFISLEELKQQLRNVKQLETQSISNQSLGVLVRQLIKYLRNLGNPIVSKRGQGYKLTSSANELNQFLSTEIARRDDLTKTINNMCRIKFE